MFSFFILTFINYTINSQENCFPLFAFPSILRASCFLHFFIFLALFRHCIVLTHIFILGYMTFFLFFVNIFLKCELPGNSICVSLFFLKKHFLYKIWIEIKEFLWPYMRHPGRSKIR